MLCVQKSARRKASHLPQHRVPPVTAKTRYLCHGYIRLAIDLQLGTEDPAASGVRVSMLQVTAAGTNAAVVRWLSLCTSLERLTY